MNKETVINSFNNRLEIFIHSFVKDPNTAKDILQDALLKIYVAYPNLKSKDKLTSWVYQITRNTIYDHFRKKQNHAELIDLPVELESDPSLNYKLLNCIKPFVNRLPEKYKDALLHTDLGNMSQKEYAAKIGLSYSGTKSIVQRARIKLRALFDQCCQIESDKYGQIMKYRRKETCACS